MNTEVIFSRKGAKRARKKNRVYSFNFFCAGCVFAIDKKNLLNRLVLYVVLAALLACIPGGAFASDRTERYKRYKKNEKERRIRLKRSIQGWEDTQEWYVEGSYSGIFFNEEAFDDIFDRDYMPMVRFGSGWYAAPNLSLGLHVGGIYDVGRGIGTITGASSGDVTLFVVPVQLNLRYRFLFLEDQILVPSVWAGADYWYFQEVNEHFENVDGDKAGFHLGGDLSILLDPAEPRSANKLKQNFGIDDTYLCLGYEYLNVGGDGGGLDFSGAAYTVGLRFEIGSKKPSE